MRASGPKALHTLLLYLLPIVVAWAGWGVGAAVLAVLGVAVAGIVARQRETLAPGSSRPRLHTISYSHFVEKVRWCMDRAGIDYEEVPSIGILGVLLLGRTVPLLELPAARTRVGNSSEILRLLWGMHGHDESGRAAFLEPTPEAAALEQHFDRALGEQVRRWAYQRLFADRRLTLQVWGVQEPAVPAWQRALLPLLRPLLEWAVRRMLRIDCGLGATRPREDACGLRRGGPAPGRRQAVPAGRYAELRGHHVCQPWRPGGASGQLWRRPPGDAVSRRRQACPSRGAPRWPDSGNVPPAG